MLPIHRVEKFHISNYFQVITLAISKCYGKVRVLFFPLDNFLISRGNSHVSRVRGLVVMLAFQPRGFVFEPVGMR